MALIHTLPACGLTTAEVTAVVRVLTDPDLPGEPWADDEIPGALAVLAEESRGRSVEVEAVSMRWLDAIASTVD